MPSQPQVLGLKKSFGFGDRLGLAGPGHIDAIRGSSFAAIFAQQSIRELTRTKREPQEVIQAARQAVEQAGWKDAWGADADHLQTPEDAVRMVKHGYTFFTIDPSAHVNRDADDLSAAALDAAYEALVAKGVTGKTEVFDRYQDQKHDLGAGQALAFNDRVALKRAVVKYGAALAFTKKLNDAIREASGTRPFEIEMSVDETPQPTSPLEHLYIGLELKRLGVKLVSLAPRFVGDFEKGIDYKGDLGKFEENYAQHLAIARYCGPYKVSVHTGSDKFKIYPIVGRLSGELLHVKTAGTSYLEALRVASRVDKKFFREVTVFARGRYEKDKATYHVSGRLADIPERVEDADLEKWYLEHESGRQILHVTFGSVLTGETGNPSFKERLLDTLHKHADLYREVLRVHLGKHIKLLGG